MKLCAAEITKYSITIDDTNRAHGSCPRCSRAFIGAARISSVPSSRVAAAIEAHWRSCAGPQKVYAQ